MNVFIQKKVIKKLSEERNTRMELALALGVSERAIWQMADRYTIKETANSSLTKYAVIQFFRDKGLSDDEIFYIEKPAEKL